MALVRCRPLEWRGEVRQALFGRSARLALDHGLCVRSTSPVARTPHSRAVSYQVHLSRDYTPHRNHLVASRAGQVTAAPLDPFRWAKTMRSTSRRVRGL